MHKSSYLNMQNFANQYLDKTRKTVIADIGSQAVQTDSLSSYKPLFECANWTYIGCDVVPGNNVDRVFNSIYSWNELKSASVDVIVSGQAFEHIEYFWITMSEIARVLKEGGYCCLIAPSAGFRHRYPVDCWRLYEDGFRALAKYVNMDVIQVFTQRNRFDSAEYDSVWNDSVLIARKPPQDIKTRLKMMLKNRLSQFLVSDLPPANFLFPKNVTAQLFFRLRGSEYSEEESLVEICECNHTEYIVNFDCRTLKNKADITDIRFDPAREAIIYGLGAADIYFMDGTHTGLQIAGSNGVVLADGTLQFDHQDPTIFFDCSDISFENVDYISFRGLASFEGSVAGVD